MHKNTCQYQNKVEDVAVPAFMLYYKQFLLILIVIPEKEIVFCALYVIEACSGVQSLNRWVKFIHIFLVLYKY